MSQERIIVNTKCCYCGRKFCDYVEGLTRTKDHFLPKSKTGSGAENKLDSCYDCNIWKADRMPQEWLEEVKKYKKKGYQYRSFTEQHFSTIITRLKSHIKNKRHKVLGDYKI